VTAGPPEPVRRESPLAEWFSTRIGGVLVPLAATVLAFLIGGLVVLLTGHNPVSAYKAIFEGTGPNWFFPWVSGEAREDAANDLQ
jgi:general nucleoside transport system permease protein